MSTTNSEKVSISKRNDSQFKKEFSKKTKCEMVKVNGNILSRPSYVPPHLMGRDLTNPTSDLVASGNRIPKPRPGVKIPYRNLTSQIVSRQEIAQEIFERSLRKNGYPDAPTDSVFFPVDLPLRKNGYPDAPADDVYFPLNVTKNISNDIDPLEMKPTKEVVIIKTKNAANLINDCSEVLEVVYKENQRSNDAAESCPEVSSSLSDSVKVPEPVKMNLNADTTKSFNSAELPLNDAALLAILEGTFDSRVSENSPVVKSVANSDQASKKLKYKRDRSLERMLALQQLREFDEERSQNRSTKPLSNLNKQEEMKKGSVANMNESNNNLTATKIKQVNKQLHAGSISKSKTVPVQAPMKLTDVPGVISAIDDYIESYARKRRVEVDSSIIDQPKEKKLKGKQMASIVTSKNREVDTSPQDGKIMHEEAKSSITMIEICDAANTEEREKSVNTRSQMKNNSKIALKSKIDDRQSTGVGPVILKKFRNIKPKIIENQADTNKQELVSKNPKLDSGAAEEAKNDTDDRQSTEVGPVILKKFRNIKPKIVENQPDTNKQELVSKNGKLDSGAAEQAKNATIFEKTFENVELKLEHEKVAETKNPVKTARNVKVMVENQEVDRTEEHLRKGSVSKPKNLLDSTPKQLRTIPVFEASSEHIEEKIDNLIFFEVTKKELKERQRISGMTRSSMKQSIIENHDAADFIGNSPTVESEIEKPEKVCRNTEESEPSIRINKSIIENPIETDISKQKTSNENNELKVDNAEEVETNPDENSMKKLREKQCLLSITRSPMKKSIIENRDDADCKRKFATVVSHIEKLEQSCRNTAESEPLIGNNKSMNENPIVTDIRRPKTSTKNNKLKFDNAEKDETKQEENSMKAANKKPHAKHNSKVKAMREINKLLADEGTINMIYSLGQKRSCSNKTTNYLASARRKRKELLLKRKLVKDAVLKMSMASGQFSPIRNRRSIPESTIMNNLSLPAAPDKNCLESSALPKLEEMKTALRRSVINEPPSTEKNDSNTVVASKLSVTKQLNFKSIRKTLPVRCSRRLKKDNSEGNPNVPAAGTDESEVVSLKELAIRKYDNLVQVILISSSTKLRNSLNAELLREFTRVLKDLQNDESCRIVLVTSTGSSFCQGIDLQALVCSDKTERTKIVTEYVNALTEFTKCLSQFQKLLVAGVHGSAVGLGVTILPYFDMIYASDKATFYTPYLKLGQIPEAGSTFTLPHLYGNAVTSELLFGCRKLTASEAFQFGLVTRVLWPDKFNEELLPLIQGITSHSAQSIDETKKLLRETMTFKLQEQLEKEAEILLRHWCSEECQTRFKNYLEEETYIS